MVAYDDFAQRDRLLARRHDRRYLDRTAKRIMVTQERRYYPKRSNGRYAPEWTNQRLPESGHR